MWQRRTKPNGNYTSDEVEANRINVCIGNTRIAVLVLGLTGKEQHGAEGSGK